MGRLFDEHILRETKSLDGAWKFRKDPEKRGISESWYLGIPCGETVAVPSVWNTTLGEIAYEGVAWYEKCFFSGGGCLRFSFGAVMTEAEIWLDGKPIGSHYGGFQQFDFIVPEVAAGEHRLTVRVDNSFDEHSIPQAKVDWYHYGGIVRGVTLETLRGICVLSHRFEYTLSEDFSSATAREVLELYNADSKKESTEVTLSLDGKTVSAATVTLDGGATLSFALPSFTLSDVRLWGVGEPNLYALSLRTETDDLCDRVGLRRIEVRDGALLLNGKAIELRGVNRHEEHPDWGFAFPLGLTGRDVDLALDMGCNAIRGSHYPNSREFVDFLDERGILFWSEIPMWGFPESALADPIVIERGLEMHREMVKYYYNHPCIVMWGMHNEIALQTEAAYRITELFHGYLRENGGNRLIVYASDKPWDDLCFGFCDVICLNRYYNWYYDYEEDAWERFLIEFCEKRRALGMEDKPIIMSEFGAAGLYGCRDDEAILWSEDNQAKLISHCLELFHRHPAVVGSFVWQFCDIRTCLQAGLNRARGFNNKGILNEYRKPKLAYRAAKALYRSFAQEE